MTDMPTKTFTLEIGMLRVSIEDGRPSLALGDACSGHIEWEDQAVGDDVEGLLVELLDFVRQHQGPSSTSRSATGS